MLSKEEKMKKEELKTLIIFSLVLIIIVVTIIINNKEKRECFIYKNNEALLITKIFENKAFFAINGKTLEGVFKNDNDVERIKNFIFEKKEDGYFYFPGGERGNTNFLLKQ